MCFKRSYLLIVLILISVSAYGMIFEDSIIRESDEKPYTGSSLRLFMHKGLNERELIKNVGEIISVEDIDQYQNYNSSDFKKYTFEGLEILFIKICGEWELFRIDILDNRYSTLRGLTIGHSFSAVTDVMGMPYKQKVLEPGLIKHSYIIEDNLAIGRAFAIELAFVYKQEGPSMIVDQLYVTLISKGI